MLKQHGRYAHAKQYKRAGRCMKTLHTLLGRVVREIRRKATSLNETLWIFLDGAIKQVERITSRQVNEAFVDKG